jgi:hypothetical protein
MRETEMRIARSLVSLIAVATMVGCAAHTEPPSQPALPADPPQSSTVLVAAPPADAPPPKPVPETIPPEVEGHFERALRELNPRTACPDFDYFPRGGLRSFWCHRPTTLTLASLRALAGVDVFASGPHKATELTLDARSAFGHYNPAFVRWLVDNFAPTPRDPRMDKHTQLAYETSVRPLAEVFFLTLAKLRRDPACFEREKAAYAGAIAKKTLPKDYYERWFYFMNPFFCSRKSAANDFVFYSDNGFDGGVDGNVTKTVIGFWLRRSMDGTLDGFAEGLQKLIAAYDPALATAKLRAPDAAALSAAVDAGVAAARTCREPGAPKSVSVELVFASNGTPRAHVQGTGSPTLSQCVESRLTTTTVPAWDGAELKFQREIVLK